MRREFGFWGDFGFGVSSGFCGVWVCFLAELWVLGGLVLRFWGNCGIFGGFLGNFGVVWVLRIGFSTFGFRVWVLVLCDFGL